MRYISIYLQVKNVSPLFAVPLPHNSASMLAFHKGSSWAHWGRGGPVRPNYFDFDLWRYISSTTFPCLKQKILFSASHKFYYDIQYDMKAYIDLMEMFLPNMHGQHGWLNDYFDYIYFCEGSQCSDRSYACSTILLHRVITSSLPWKLRCILQPPLKCAQTKNP